MSQDYRAAITGWTARRGNVQDSAQRVVPKRHQGGSV